MIGIVPRSSDKTNNHILPSIFQFITSPAILEDPAAFSKAVCPTSDNCEFPEHQKVTDLIEGLGTEGDYNRLTANNMENSLLHLKFGSSVRITPDSFSEPFDLGESSLRVHCLSTDKKVILVEQDNIRQFFRQSSVAAGNSGIDNEDSLGKTDGDPSGSTYDWTRLLGFRIQGYDHTWKESGPERKVVCAFSKRPSRVSNSPAEWNVEARRTTEHAFGSILQSLIGSNSLKISQARKKL